MPPSTSTPATTAGPTTGRPRTRRGGALFVLAAVGTVAGAAAACTSASGPARASGVSAAATGAKSGTPPRRAAVITITNFSFEPAVLRVTPGQSVTVVDADGVAHTVTSVSGAFDSGDVQPGRSVHFTAPSRPGTYRYRCTIHQFMTGTLVVTSG